MSGAAFRVLGIDPGSAVTGWGVVEEQDRRMRMVAAGCIRTAASQPLPERMVAIFRGVMEVIARHDPREAAVEEVFVAANARSAVLLGHARGAAIVAAGSGGLSVHEYSALQVKKGVVGYGQAEKGQVQEMMRRLLSLSQAPSQDAADALAVAVYHLHQRPFRRLNAAAVARR